MLNEILKLGAKVYGTGYSPNQNKNLFYKYNILFGSCIPIGANVSEILKYAMFAAHEIKINAS